MAGKDGEIFMTKRLNVTPKTTEQHLGLIARSDKSVAYVGLTNNERLCSTFCTIETNYWQIRSIARPLYDSRATCYTPPAVLPSLEKGGDSVAYSFNCPTPYERFVLLTHLLVICLLEHAKWSCWVVQPHNDDIVYRVTAVLEKDELWRVLHMRWQLFCWCDVDSYSSVFGYDLSWH